MSQDGNQSVATLKKIAPADEMTRGEAWPPAFHALADDLEAALEPAADHWRETVNPRTLAPRAAARRPSRDADQGVAQGAAQGASQGVSGGGVAEGGGVQPRPRWPIRDGWSTWLGAGATAGCAFFVMTVSAMIGAELAPSSERGFGFASVSAGPTASNAGPAFSAPSAAPGRYEAVPERAAPTRQSALVPAPFARAPAAPTFPAGDMAVGEMAVGDLNLNALSSRELSAGGMDASAASPLASPPAALR